MPHPTGVVSGGRPWAGDTGTSFLYEPWTSPHLENKGFLLACSSSCLVLGVGDLESGESFEAACSPRRDTAMSTGKDWAGFGWQAGGDGGKADGELNENGDYLGEKGEI